MNTNSNFKGGTNNGGRSCLVYRRDGNLTLDEFLASFKGLEETTWIASDDMKPFLELCKSYFKKLITKRK